MFKMSSRYIFFLFAMCLSLGTVSDLSAQSRDGRAENHQSEAVQIKLERLEHTKRQEYFKTLLPKKL